MGQEVDGALVRGRSRVTGRAYFEGDHLLFRGGDSREKVMLASVTKAEVVGESLVLTHSAGVTRLSLPVGTAAKWLAKIQNPRSRLDKLGVKAGMRVAVLGVNDADFLDELRNRVGDISLAAVTACDVIFLSAESPKELSVLDSLRTHLVPAGAIWVVHRKGKDATLKDVEVFAAAKRVALVDTKVASFSPTHTAERLVIPLALRARGDAR